MMLLFLPVVMSLAVPEPPAILTQADPGMLLRWKAVHLTPHKQTSVGAPIFAQAAGPALLRLHVVARKSAAAASQPGCRLGVKRRFGVAPSFADVALSTSASSGADADTVVVVPPAVVEAKRVGVAAKQAGDDEPESTFVIEPTAACGVVFVEAYVGTLEDDEGSGLRVASGVRALRDAQPGDDALAAWLDAAHPHRWQQDVALALGLGRALQARAGGAVPPDSKILVDALLACALRAAPLGPAKYLWHRPVAFPGPSRTIADDPEPSTAIDLGKSVDVDVDGWEAIRVAVRLPMDKAQPGAIAARLRLSIDDRPPTTIPILAGREAESPEVTRAQSFTWPLPLGARHVQLTAVDRPVLLRASVVRRKQSLAAAAATLAAALRGDRRPAAQSDAGTTAPAANLAAALRAAERADVTADRDAAAQAIASADQLLASATTVLDKAVARLMVIRAQRLAIQRDIDAGRFRPAMRRLIDLGQRGGLTDEDAAILGGVEAFVPDGAMLASQALATIDGLLSGRPLDRQLWLTRMHVYAAGTHWRRLGTNADLAEVAFLEPVPDGAPAPLGRTAFSPLAADGSALEINVPRPLQPHLRPVVSLIALRGTGGAPGLRQVLADGAPVAQLPALTELDHFEIALDPGFHKLALGAGDFQGQVLCNYGTNPPAFQLRRYVQLPAPAIAFQSREVGPPAIAALAVRFLGPAGTPLAGAVPIEVSAGGTRLVAVDVHAGADQPPSPGDVDPASWLSAPVEVTFPISARTSEITVSATPPPGVRVLVNLSLRERRAPFDAVAPPPSAAPASPAAAVSGAATTLVDRALMLAERDEVLLARETVVSALADPTADDRQFPILAGLWHQLEELQGAAGTTASRLPISPALALLPVGDAPERMAPALRDVLGDKDALGRLSASALRQRPGGQQNGDLVVLAAARLAELSANPQRAATLWLDLSRAHPASPSVRRQAGVVLLSIAPLSAAMAARAYVEIFAASQLDPADSVTMRMLRRANSRTRLRMLALPDQSAGSFQVRAGPSDEGPDNIDALMAPRLADVSQAATLLCHGRDLTLSFALPRTSGVALNIVPLELRPHTAAAMRPESIAVEWAIDAGVANRYACAASAGPCMTPNVTLSAGPHVIVARIQGGIRPAAWITVESDGAGSRKSGARSRSAFSPVPIVNGLDYLVATPEAPIKLTVQGPVVVKVELRTPAAEPRAHRALVRATAIHQDAVEREIIPNPGRDPRAVAAGNLAGALTMPQVEYVSLPNEAMYAVEIKARSGLALVRLAVREGADEENVAETAAFAVPSAEAPPAVEPLGLARSPAVELRDGDLSPGWDDVGSIEAWSSLVRTSTNPDGAPVQRHTSLHIGIAYRRLIETLHTTAKLQASGRAHSEGQPSQTVSGELFFMHPAFRAIRLEGYADLYTQPLQGQRAWTKDVGVMLEPVATLTPGLHLVSKLSTWWSTRSLPHLTPAQLSLIDPDVYSYYAEQHPHGLFWEEGLEAEPFVNMVLYANARLTTNPSFSPLDRDHLSVSVFARTLLGRSYAEIAGRSTWFRADQYRLRATRHETVFLRLFQTLWPSERNAVDVAVTAAYDFATRSPEFLISTSWEWSNGRRFQDHSPLEGEDFFFPQRGPGPGTSQVTVSPSQ